MCGTNGFEMNIWSKSNGNLDSAKHIYLTIKTCCSPEWTKYILYVHVFLIIRSIKRKTNGYRVEHAKRYTYRQFIHIFFCLRKKPQSISEEFGYGMNQNKDIHHQQMMKF